MNKHFFSREFEHLGINIYDPMQELKIASVCQANSIAIAEIMEFSDFNRQYFINRKVNVTCI